MRILWKWRVYDGDVFIGEVLAETFQGACRRAAHRFGNRSWTIVRAGRDG